MAVCRWYVLAFPIHGSCQGSHLRPGNVDLLTCVCVACRSKWKERLVHLCDVSATELYGDSYYWGEDLDGEPDTLWGLEGYTHPIGFFIDHVSSNIFKREMALVDKDELLRHQQGLGSPDYDLHHYDQESGWLKREDDTDRHSKSGHVAVHHFWASSEADRPSLLAALGAFAADTRSGQNHKVQSCLVLRECRDLKMATLWLRYVQIAPPAYSLPA
ncbi:uncharacterized protein AUP68_09312 [Ilyonectria robusta]